MCYQFAGMELLTPEWLGVIANIGTFLVSIGVVAIAEAIRRSQVADVLAEKIAATDRMKARLLYRLEDTTSMAEGASRVLKPIFEGRPTAALVHYALRGIKAPVSRVAVHDEERSLLSPELVRAAESLESSARRLLSLLEAAIERASSLQEDSFFPEELKQANLGILERVTELGKDAQDLREKIA